jgi:hypothetical protein
VWRSKTVPPNHNPSGLQPHPATTRHPAITRSGVPESLALQYKPSKPNCSKARWQWAPRRLLQVSVHAVTVNSDRELARTSTPKRPWEETAPGRPQPPGQPQVHHQS